MRDLMLIEYAKDFDGVTDEDLKRSISGWGIPSWMTDAEDIGEMKENCICTSKVTWKYQRASQAHTDNIWDWYRIYGAGIIGGAALPTAGSIGIQVARQYGPSIIIAVGLSGPMVGSAIARIQGGLPRAPAITKNLHGVVNRVSRLFKWPGDWRWGIFPIIEWDCDCPKKKVYPTGGWCEEEEEEEQPKRKRKYTTGTLD